MGVNWAAGLIYWKPHVSRSGKVYSLTHVHPFRYSDDRETRAFSLERYAWAFRLKSILASLDKRKCYFTHRANYATVDMNDLPLRQEYQIYFDLRKKAAYTIELVVQSAYVETDEALKIGGQIVRFQTLVGLGLAGKKPKRPP